VTQDAQLNNARYGENDDKLKADREKTFPAEVLERAMKLELEKAVASQVCDRTHILNVMANGGKPFSDIELNATTPNKNDNYDKLNVELRGTFPVAAWRQALETGSVQLRKLCAEVLSADCGRKLLKLQLSSCPVFNDEAL